MEKPVIKSDSNPSQPDFKLEEGLVENPRHSSGGALNHSSYVWIKEEPSIKEEPLDDRNMEVNEARSGMDCSQFYGKTRRYFTHSDDRDDNDDTDEFPDFGKVLQQKLKNHSNYYSRKHERVAKVKCGPAVLRKTQYVFSSQLPSLHKGIKSKGTTTIEAAAQERPPDSKQPSISSALQCVEERGGIRKKEKTSPEVDHLVNVLQASIQLREEQEKLREDDDRLFLLSLLVPLKKIPKHLQFHVRMQIMQVIDNSAKIDDFYNLN